MFKMMHETYDQKNKLTKFLNTSNIQRHSNNVYFGFKIVFLSQKNK